LKMLVLGHFKHEQMQQIRKLPGNTVDGLPTLFCGRPVAVNQWMKSS
jgi:hypothetical protein